MSRVSTYLNFMGTTEEAFNFYRSVFGTEITGQIARIGDMPSAPGGSRAVRRREGDGRSYRVADPGWPRTDGYRHGRVHGT